MKRSSWILLGMTWWWILPFCLADILSHPFRANLRSHALYLVTLAVSLACARLLGWADDRFGLWARWNDWGRWLLVMGAYAVQMALLVAALVFMDARRWLAYYGGDAGGSVGLVYLPSVVFYLAAGTSLVAILQVVRWGMRRLRRPSRD